MSQDENDAMKVRLQGYMSHRGLSSLSMNMAGLDTARFFRSTEMSTDEALCYRIHDGITGFNTIRDRIHGSGVATLADDGTITMKDKTAPVKSALHLYLSALGKVLELSIYRSMQIHVFLISKVLHAGGYV